MNTAQKIVADVVVELGFDVRLRRVELELDSRAELLLLALQVVLRRIRSIARCFAVAISHAPGLSGTPDSGHCSSAATSASCASSSARPTSRTMRVRPAIRRGIRSARPL